MNINNTVLQGRISSRYANGKPTKDKNCTAGANLINGQYGSFVTFVLAVDESLNQENKRVTYVKVKAHCSEKLVPYMKTGKPVSVIGRIESPEAYIDKNGEAKAIAVVSASTVQFVNFGMKEQTSTDASSAPKAKVARTNDPIPAELIEEIAIPTEIAEPTYEEFDDSSLPF